MQNLHHCKLLIKALLAAAAGVLGCNLSQAQTPPSSYLIDPSHTFVTFEIGHFNTSTNRGRFDRKVGNVQFDRNAKTGSVDITVDMASINTGTAAFDSFLTGFQMFDAVTYPTAHFMAKQFDFSGEELKGVNGELTLLGKTRNVALKTRQFNCYRSPLFGREVCGGDFEATIDRTEWGLNYGLIFGFPRQVRLLIQVEAIRQ